MLKKLKDAPYELKTCILSRKSYKGNRKKIDEIDMNLGVFTRDTYFYTNFDFIIMGVNPLVNIILASYLEKIGKSVLISTNRMQDSWDYNILSDLNFQKQISLKFKLGFRFLTKEGINERTLVFLEDFFLKMNLFFKKSTYISNSDIVISSHMKKFDKDYVFQSQLGQYKDKLPFNTPKIENETLYNKMFNMFYKIYSTRENDWCHATDIENHKDKINLSKKMNENAYYHILCPKFILSSHYHPYINDNELEDNSVFRVIQSASLEGLEHWIS